MSEAGTGFANRSGRALMLQGTGSDVGKTVLVAGLCRLAFRNGISVLPFKPQNMSNNAAVTPDGGEIGRGQWLQAFAAGVVPDTDMNPVLLKPQAEGQVQVIVRGHVHATVSGRAYQQLKRDLQLPVLDSFSRLRQRADLVLVEGAGSASEINLRDGDIANMGFAAAAQIPVVLVGDIDRGGVIASLVGTLHILPEADRRLIHGFIINKFRGDPVLFEEGSRAITDHTGWRSLGMVPWSKAFAYLPAEDSLCLTTLRTIADSTADTLKIVVPLLSHIANFDDIAPLETEEAVEIIWLRPGEKWPQQVDLVILTGNKATIAAMEELEKSCLANELRAYVARGGTIVGICGGLQMLGKVIYDPDGLEGAPRQIAGLGLLDVETVMQRQKTLRNIVANERFFGGTVAGYEIHLGKSYGADCARAPILVDGRPNGAASADGRVWGTYLHGLFADGAFRASYIGRLGGQSDGRNYEERLDEVLDEIADILEKSLDVASLLALAR